MGESSRKSGEIQRNQYKFKKDKTVHKPASKSVSQINIQMSISIKQRENIQIPLLIDDLLTNIGNLRIVQEGVQ